VLWILGEYQEAKLLHQEMLAMNRHTGGPAGIARSFGNLGMDAMGLEELEEARQLLEESLAPYGEIGHLHGMRDELGDLAELAYVMGEHAKAAMTVFRYADAMPLRVIGNAACALGDLQEARNYLHQALELSQLTKWTAHTLLTLVG
jgi:tetratricopeptide (TPR) repeat protein